MTGGGSLSARRLARRVSTGIAGDTCYGRGRGTWIAGCRRVRDAVLNGEKALNLDAWCVQDVKVREAEGERVQNRDAEHNEHIHFLGGIYLTQLLLCNA